MVLVVISRITLRLQVLMMLLFTMRLIISNPSAPVIDLRATPIFSTRLVQRPAFLRWHKTLLPQPSHILVTPSRHVPLPYFQIRAPRAWRPRRGELATLPWLEWREESIRKAMGSPHLSSTAPNTTDLTSPSPIPHVDPAYAAACSAAAARAAASRGGAFAGLRGVSRAGGGEHAGGRGRELLQWGGGIDEKERQAKAEQQRLRLLEAAVEKEVILTSTYSPL